jgi:hypothetical protein
MRKRPLLVGIAAASAVVLSAGAAQAVSDSDISVSFAHTRAYQTYPYPAAQYNGVLQVKSGCLEMQQRTSLGNWTTAGFYQDSVEVNPLIDCAGGVTYETWKIVFGNGTYGIRATDGPRIITHCDTKANCEVLRP